MAERGISLHRHYPKHLYAFSLSSFDLIVNLSRRQLPRTPVPILRFPVPNPVGQPEDFHREVRNIVEHLVEMVLLEVSGRRDILSLATRTGNLGRCFGTPAPIRLPGKTRTTQRAESVLFQ